MEKSSARTVSQSEIECFKLMAASTWDVNGPWKLLHSMNTLRTDLILNGLMETGRILNTDGPRPLEGIEVLEVGCGGGILSEALARLGASITGVDPVEENIAVAQSHMDKALKINYVCTTAEEFLEEYPHKLFDAVVASEVLEHVNNPRFLLHTMEKFVKPGGSIFVSTINRTYVAWLVAIIFAEYILRMVPIGTHHYSNFITPEETATWLNECSMKTMPARGMLYNIFTGRWLWSRINWVSWAMHAVKIDRKKIL